MVMTMQCKAKAKSTGQRCNRSAVNGYEVCQVHGGKTPRGLASPNWKDGTYSKYLPTNLKGRFDEAMSDPELVSLRGDLALYQVHLSERLERLATGENRNLWQQLHASWVTFTTTPDDKRRAAALENIGRLIEAGADVERTWLDIYMTLEQRRKTAETEHKRLTAMDQMVTAEELVNVFARFTEGILRIVSNAQERAALSDLIIDVLGKEER